MRDRPATDYPLRRVLHSTFRGDGKWDAWDHLECGHEMFRVWSWQGATPRTRRRCRKCPPREVCRGPAHPNDNSAAGMASAGEE